MRKRVIWSLLIISIALIGLPLSLKVSTFINLNGKWYLYNGSDIRYEDNLLENLNSLDYIEISGESFYTHGSNGKDGVSSFAIKKNKIYSGDGIFTFEVEKVNGEKVLYLNHVGNRMGGKETKEVNGAKLVYIKESSNISLKKQK